MEECNRLKKYENAHKCFKNYNLEKMTWICYLFVFKLMGVNSHLIKLHGPSLIKPLENIRHFSNNIGASVSCLPNGHPPLSVMWLLASTNKPLTHARGLREMLSNGTLYFPPFKSIEYSPTIHSTEYRCAVKNSLGIFLSNAISIQAVIDQSFDVSIRMNGGTGSEGTISEGETVVLTCDVSPKYYKNYLNIISWKTVDEFGYGDEILSDGKRYHITEVGSLVILHKNSGFSSAKIYVCSVENNLTGNRQSSSPFMINYNHKGSIIPSAPRALDMVTQTIEKMKGSPVDLICSIHGDPYPDIKWMKLTKGMMVPVVAGKIHEQILLSITQVDSSDNGTYQCEATNSYGSMAVQFHLIVKYHPRLKIVEAGTNAFDELKIGQTRLLICSGFLKEFIREIKWLKDGKKVSESNRVSASSHKLKISNVQYSDQGVYQCFVKTVENVESMASAALIFPASAPKFVNAIMTQTVSIGSSSSFKCLAEGNPKPSISWFLDKQSLNEMSLSSSNVHGLGSYTTSKDDFTTPSSSYLIATSKINIRDAHLRDSGMYECTANNTFGTVSQSARLNVYGPIFVKQMGTLTIKSGSSVNIPCSFGGYPVDNIRWEKGRQGISQIRNAYQSTPDGPLKIQNANKEDHNGEYSCQVSNQNGEAASGSFTVTVIQPPVIAPFTFMKNLALGQRTSVTCNVIAGDLPVYIRWMKDHNEIQSYLNISVTRDKFLSYLMFEKLDEVHTGTYTCTAWNEAAEIDHSASLVVNVPPTWITKPKNVKAKLNSFVSINCAAYGVPSPIVTWFKEKESHNVTLNSDGNLHIHENGSLTIKSMTESHEGNYTVRATNGVTFSLTEKISITIYRPPRALLKLDTQMTAEGARSVLKCQVFGDLPLNIEWIKEFKPLKTLKEEISIENTFTTNGSVSTSMLTIYNTSKSDAGRLTCLVSNPFGRDEAVIDLIVKGRPSTPEDFIVEEIGSRFVKLRWTAKRSLEVPVTHFLVQFKKSERTSWTPGNDSYVRNQTVQSSSNSITLDTLHPVTNYDMRILAFNEMGYSLPSEPLSVLTLPEAPSGPPTNVSAVPINAKTIQIKWEPPLEELRNGDILGYRISARLQKLHSTLPSATVDKERSSIRQFYISSESNFTSIRIDEEWRREAEMSGLKPNSHYRLSVKAYNSAGIGPESPFITVYTPEGAPESSPRTLQCDSTSPRSLQVKWKPPVSHLAHGKIQGYKMIYQPIADEILGKKPEIKKTFNEATILHGLLSFTNYSVRALAFTKGGDGVLSNPIFCTTDEDVPDEPEAIKVKAQGPGTIVVSWLPPAKANGVIIKYVISWRSEEIKSVHERIYPTDTARNDPLAQYSLEIRGLRPNTKYTFWVTAATLAGLGNPSRAPSDVKSPSKFPGAILSFPMVRRAVQKETFLFPCNHVGRPAPSVVWFRLLPHGREPIPSYHLARNGSLKISKVKPSDEGKYLCRVENSDGFEEIRHSLIIIRPPPKMEVILGYVTHSSMQLHWEVNDVDPPVLGFWLSFRKEHDLDWMTERLGPEIRSHTIDGLDCGGYYEFKICASNRLGNGEMSDVLTAKMSGSMPAIPKLTDVLSGNGTYVMVDLLHWPDGGCPIKDFYIEYKLRSSSDWQRIYRSNSQARIFDFPSLKDEFYDVRITVKNDAGTSSHNFLLKSSSTFFFDYETTMEKIEGDKEKEVSSVLSDPHVIVPVISSVVCTMALIICALIVFKRRRHGKEEWRYVNSNSLHTWLSSENNQQETDANQYKAAQGEALGPVYATLTSRSQIPMTIRDSTLRLQSFGHRDNYSAPSLPVNTQKNARSKSVMESFAQIANDSSHDSKYFKKIEFYPESEDYHSSADEESITNYAQPYHVSEPYPASRSPIFREISQPAQQSHFGNVMIIRKNGKRTKEYFH